MKMGTKLLGASNTVARVAVHGYLGKERRDEVIFGKR